MIASQQFGVLVDVVDDFRVVEAMSWWRRRPSLSRPLLTLLVNPMSWAGAVDK